MNDGEFTARLDAADAAAPATQVTANVALIIFRCDVFDFHDRLEQDRFALLEAIFHREDGGEFECEFVRVDFVETSVNDVHLNIDNGVTAEGAVENSFVDSLLNRRDVFSRTMT